MQKKTLKIASKTVYVIPALKGIQSEGGGSCCSYLSYRQTQDCKGRGVEIADLLEHTEKISLCISQF